MKKTILIMVLLLMSFGCSCSLLNMDNTPKQKVEALLEKYQKNDEVVLTELDDYIATQSLTEDQQDVYRDILKKQYTDLKYRDVEEKIDGDEATVTATIVVYDLFGVQKEAESYLQKNATEFQDENKEYDKELFIDYKLKNMKDNTKTVEYDLTFTLNKIDGEWTVNQIDTDNLEKIHGIYDYTED